MRGSEVVYAGPARIVLAAAAALRDPDLIERYREEWLANLRHRTHLQQWRDALSLLLRGTRATRWAYHSQPRAVVASQMAMALIVAIGTVLLLTTTALWGITMWGFAVRQDGDVLWRDDPSILDILAISLTAAGAVGLVLLTRRSWRTALGWLSIGIFTIQTLANILPRGMYYIDQRGGGVELSTFVLAEPGFASAGAWWVVTVSYWVFYAALTLFVSHKIPPVMRVLAASEVVVIIYLTSPDWASEYADRVGLTGLVPWLAGLLHMPPSEEITAVRAAPGIGLLVSMFIVVAAWRCVVIATSLVMVSRRGPSGARICPR